MQTVRLNHLPLSQLKIGYELSVKLKIRPKHVSCILSQETRVRFAAIVRRLNVSSQVLCNQSNHPIRLQSVLSSREFLSRIDRKVVPWRSG